MIGKKIVVGQLRLGGKRDFLDMEVFISPVQIPLIYEHLFHKYLIHWSGYKRYKCKKRKILKGYFKQNLNKLSVNYNDFKHTFISNVHTPFCPPVNLKRFVGKVIILTPFKINVSYIL